MSSEIRLEKPIHNAACMPAAFASVTGIPQEKWLAEIGHDGRDIIFDLPPPRCFRGFHPQEFIRAGLKLGVAIVEILMNPVSTPDTRIMYNLQFPPDNLQNFIEVLRGRRAVLCGLNARGVGHAVPFFEEFSLDWGFGMDAARPTVHRPWPGYLKVISGYLCLRNCS